LGRAVSPKRLAFLVVLASLAAVVLVSAAPAGSIDDGDPCPKGGNGNLVCPVGTEGVPYSIKFHGDEDPICAPGDDKWYANGGTPPGLTLVENGQLSGTPTQAGTYEFWLELKLPDYTNPDGSGCSSRDNSEERVVITINPGIPKLTIGPESAPVGTVSTPYSLQMTATVADPKTWSVSSGSLPPGLALDPSTGVISGMPTAAGAFTFEVLARMVSDSRSDTKVLGIVVRDPLRITADEAFTPARRAQAEVSAPFTAVLAATGGEGTYTWALSNGALPSGLTLTDGVIEGTPGIAGVYRITVTVTDAEGRIANYLARIVVAQKLAIVTRALRAGTVGALYRAKLLTVGGVKPTWWTLLRGSLPRGVRLDSFRGTLSGKAKKEGRYRLTFEAQDELGITAKRTFMLVVKPAKKQK
jgi:hypothetical protein